MMTTPAASRMGVRALVEDDALLTFAGLEVFDADIDVEEVAPDAVVVDVAAAVVVVEGVVVVVAAAGG